MKPTTWWNIKATIATIIMATIIFVVAGQAYDIATSLPIIRDLKVVKFIQNKVEKSAAFFDDVKKAVIGLYDNTIMLIDNIVIDNINKGEINEK